MIGCYLDLERYLIEGKCPARYTQLATRRIYILKAEKKLLIKFMKDYKNEK